MSSAANKRQEGRIARMNRKALKDNPYYPPVGISKEWAKGWLWAKGWSEADKEYIKSKNTFCPCCGKDFEDD